MNPWLSFGIGLFVGGCGGFCLGFVMYTLFKIGSDSDRLREGYLQKLMNEEKEGQNGDRINS